VTSLFKIVKDQWIGYDLKYNEKVKDELFSDEINDNYLLLQG
jgi:hypothetical protein